MSIKNKSPIAKAMGDLLYNINNIYKTYIKHMEGTNYYAKEAVMIDIE